MSYKSELEKLKEQRDKNTPVAHKMNKEEELAYKETDYSFENITTEEEIALDEDYKKYIMWLKSLE